MSRIHHKDNGYAWIVLAACFLLHIICDGINLSFGVLTPLIRHDFETDSATAVFIGSLNIGISCMLAPIIITLIKVMSYRKVTMFGIGLAGLGLICCGFCNTTLELILLYGVVTGTGISMILVPAQLIINEYFEKKRALAYGIYYTGSSFGCLAFGPIVTFISKNSGIQSVFVIEGIVTYSCLFLGYLMASPTSDSESKKEAENCPQNVSDTTTSNKGFFKALFQERIWSNKGYILYLTSMILVYLPLLIPILHIPSFALNSGVTNISRTQAGFALTILGTFNLFGRLLSGTLDTFPKQILKINAVATLFCGLSLVAMPYCKTYQWLYVVSAIFGFMSATMVVLSPCIVTLIVGAESFGRAYGIVLLVFGMASMAGNL